MKPFTPYRNTKSQQLLNKQELKFLDTSISTTLDTTVEVTNNLCIVTQGDANNNRDGAVIRVKSVQITGRLAQVPGAAATSAGVAYIWLVLDRQPNGASLAVTNYLTTTSAPEALPLVANQYRFKTLAKLAVPLNSQAGVTTAYNNCAMPVDIFYRFKTPIEVRYTANAGAITDVSTNNIALVTGAADVDDTISFVGTARIRFTG